MAKASATPVTEQQLGIARHYSEKYGLPTDSASVLALARLVPADFTGERKQDKAWKFELRHGRIPTRTAVRNRMFFFRIEQERQPLRLKAKALAAHLDYDRLGPQVADWILAYVDTHGTGPLWSEVGKEWGWDRIHTHAIIKALHRAGWVTSTPQRRSLRPSQPGGAEARPSLPQQSNAEAVVVVTHP